MSLRVKALNIAKGDTITFVDMDPPRSVTVADVIPLADGSVRVEVENGQDEDCPCAGRATHYEWCPARNSFRPPHP